MISGTQPARQAGRQAACQAGMKRLRGWRGDAVRARTTREEVDASYKLKKKVHFYKGMVEFIKDTQTILSFFRGGLNIVLGGRRQAIIPPSAEA